MSVADNYDGREYASNRCTARTEVWTRVVGFFRPVGSFNPGKQAEYHHRVPFKVEVGR